MLPETIDYLYRLSGFLKGRQELMERLILREGDELLKSSYKGARDELIIALREIKSFVEKK